MMVSWGKQLLTFEERIVAVLASSGGRSLPGWVESCAEGEKMGEDGGGLKGYLYPQPVARAPVAGNKGREGASVGECGSREGRKAQP